MAKVRGSRELRAAIRRAPAELRDEALQEVRRSTKNMYDDAIRRLATASAYAPFEHGGAGMQSITGTVRRYYRWSVSKTRLSGRVGLLSTTAAKRAFYLRFFLDGTAHQPARPIHDDAFEAERDVYIANQKRAMDRIMRRVFP